MRRSRQLQLKSEKQLRIFLTWRALSGVDCRGKGGNAEAARSSVNTGNVWRVANYW
ncbi:hypothetical protein ANCCAN_13468 [Ancylostoma caninum]|uniref:Uncharacterized protein n=1 Tax=Ancylostoma caninum TaxID=29170 RepID=A0A368G861_ANCCA|nr:hypothetical protein ANCCAN_13468 [Ancylostoma caninum]